MPHNRINYAAYTSPEVAVHGASRKRISTPLVLMIAAATLMGAHMIARPSFDKIQQSFIDVASPFVSFAQKPLNALDTRVQEFIAWTSIRKDNDSLRAENEKLKEWYQAALMLQSENKALRDLLHVDRDSAQNFITTRVIADGSNTYAKSLVIQGGKDAGVLKGQGVITHEGLIGRVIEAGARTSRVLLLQDINSRIPVTVEGTNERAIMAGTNASMPVLDHVPADAKITAGQRVITSGLGGLFPFGIPIGETTMNGDGTIGVKLYAASERAQHVQIVDYGIKPLLADPIFSSTAAATEGHGSSEPN